MTSFFTGNRRLAVGNNHEENHWLMLNKPWPVLTLLAVFLSCLSICAFSDIWRHEKHHHPRSGISTYTQMLHVCNIYLRLPCKWPSFVDRYSSTMVRIWDIDTSTMNPKGGHDLGFSRSAAFASWRCHGYSGEPPWQADTCSGWKKSCTTWDGWNTVNNGIDHLPTGAEFLPSTVVCWSPLSLSVLFCVSLYLNLYVDLHLNLISASYRSMHLCIHLSVCLYPSIPSILSTPCGSKYALQIRGRHGLWEFPILFDWESEISGFFVVKTGQMGLLSSIPSDIFVHFFYVMWAKQS